MVWKSELAPQKTNTTLHPPKETREDGEESNSNHGVFELIRLSLLLAPRSADSDAVRKTPLDTTHTRGELWNLFLLFPTLVTFFCSAF